MWYQRKKGINKNPPALAVGSVKYHDVGRTNDLPDFRHGAASAKIYAESHPEGEHSKLVQTLIELHCIDDEIAIKKLERRQDYDKYVKLLSILKDVDALDRVRFGIKAVDLRQLRNDFSLKYLLLANILVTFNF